MEYLNLLLEKMECPMVLLGIAAVNLVVLAVVLIYYGIKEDAVFFDRVVKPCMIGTLITYIGISVFAGFMSAMCTALLEGLTLFAIMFGYFMVRFVSDLICSLVESVRCR